MSRIESFEIEIPQLNRSRIVWVYLPDGYDDGDCFPVEHAEIGVTVVENFHVLHFFCSCHKLGRGIRPFNEPTFL